MNTNGTREHGVISTGETDSSSAGAESMGTNDGNRWEYIRHLSESLRFKENIRRRSEGLAPLFGILPSDMPGTNGNRLLSNDIELPEDERGIVFDGYSTGEDGTGEGEDDIPECSFID